MKSLPKGFRGAAIAAGLKSTGALDLTLIENTGPLFDAAAVYTTNKVVAAPVIWSREKHHRENPCRGWSQSLQAQR